MMGIWVKAEGEKEFIVLAPHVFVAETQAKAENLKDSCRLEMCGLLCLKILK